MKFSALAALSLAAAVSAGPTFQRRAAFTLQNGKDAIALNDKFSKLTPDSSCQTGEDACVDNKFAQCVSGKFVLQQCGGGTICAALPLVNSAGTSITCTTAADRDARIAATGATAGADTGAAASSSAAATSSAVNNAASGNAGNSVATSTSAAAAATSSAAAAAGGDNSDPQKSTTLVQSVIATGFQNDGQDQPTAGQVPSLTSSNNFINFCATVPNLPITNGKQIQTGSCNPAPMGVIASSANMPSSKFVNPKNGATIPANQNFTIQMAISHLETGHFTNAQENYFAAPQVVNGAGDVQGHSHVVVEALTSLDQTTVTDPSKFAFFKGLNDPAKNGVLSVEVAGGLPAGTYRVASINAAANHQPVLVAIAQHGSLDDMAYFTVA
ncbi:uncharacterized protein TRAVEDRAFT_149286 [Trametes versicolor FP-101664 SS1]|uniref:uncharacterized protein n=1 Tax=Trametes versicolor (strain FP-101664) TaxID=717944 RepID=UPI0004623E6A|nr:uncharacterized protein TRAVEDRAFT_149286 [Trametes versicolor FP-101664 SS1]EIW58849.1 hypothetical protein TRAVEDRAFT_149286 [Trametes versicolor FP-101664 SS1]